MKNKRYIKKRQINIKRYKKRQIKETDEHKETDEDKEIYKVIGKGDT